MTRVALLVCVAFILGACRERTTVRDPAEVAVPPVGMVFVPGGRFTMGAHGTAGAMPPGMTMADEPMPHMVTVAAFHIDRTEVTNADFARFVAATPYRTTAEGCTALITPAVSTVKLA